MSYSPPVLGRSPQGLRHAGSHGSLVHLLSTALLPTATYVSGWGARPLPAKPDCAWGGLADGHRGSQQQERGAGRRVGTKDIQAAPECETETDHQELVALCGIPTTWNGVCHTGHTPDTREAASRGIWLFHHEKGSLRAQWQKGASGISQAEPGSERVCPRLGHQG